MSKLKSATGEIYKIIYHMKLNCNGPKSQNKKCIYNYKSGDCMYSQGESENFKRYYFKCKDCLTIVTKIQCAVTGIWLKGKLYKFE